MLYTLQVSCLAVKERRGWEKGTSGDTVAPEWVLYQIRENQKDRVDLWRMATGDLAIIENLLEESLHSSQPAPRQSIFQDDPASYQPAESPSEQQKSLSSSQQMFVSQNFPQPEPPQTHSQEIAGSGIKLSGNIKEVDLASILQSISLCKMTGRLNVYDAMRQAEIFFREGELIHALSGHLMDTTTETKGETVILEVFTWDDGTFQFQHGWQTGERTVQKRLQNLVLEGAALRDYKAFVDQAGVTTETVMTRAEALMTEAQFDSKLANGLPLHVDLQKKVFLVLSQPRSLAQILSAVPMDRMTWISVIFSLLNCKLIAAQGSGSGKAGAQVDQSAAEAFSNIAELIGSANKGLLQPDSGMYSYALFLSFAEKEFERRISFCVAMFEFNVPAISITNEGLKSVAACFDSIKKPYEIIAFWRQPNRLLMLLPQSQPADAVPRINSFLDQLAKQNAGEDLSMVCGLACAPTDGTKLVDVLSLTYRLIKKAQQTNVRILTNSAPP